MPDPHIWDFLAPALAAASQLEEIRKVLDTARPVVLRTVADPDPRPLWVVDVPLLRRLAGCPEASTPAQLPSPACAGVEIHHCHGGDT